MFFFLTDNSDKKICSFSWSRHSKRKINLASKNRQLMLFNVKKIIWSGETLRFVRRNWLSLRGILGSCSIQMVTNYKIWPFKSENLLHSISIVYSKGVKHIDEIKFPTYNDILIAFHTYLWSHYFYLCKLFPRDINCAVYSFSSSTQQMLYLIFSTTNISRLYQMRLSNFFLNI